LAGIGFELRRLLRRDSLWGLLRAYGYAGLISSGPWVLSILGVMGIGLASLGRVPALAIRQFLVSVTYLMASSLVLTGLLQLLLTRFVADRLFEKREDAVLPNFFGALALTTAGAGLVAAATVGLFFGGVGLGYRALMVVGFVTLCDLWIVVVLLTGLKAYRAVLGSFLLGYAASVAGALALRGRGLEGLLAGFVAGQVVLLFLLLVAVVRRYPAGACLVSFAFLGRRSFWSLVITGVFYNLGIWVDKFVFWANPVVSDPVIGPLRASLIYDIPIFLAYLSIVPGMAVFLVRVETDFADSYDAFYDAVRNGQSLLSIQRLKGGLSRAARRGVGDIFKVQGIALLILLLVGPRFLAFIGISPLYLHLFYIDLLGVGTQVLMLAVFNVLFYLDQRRGVLVLSSLFAACNLLLTILTQRLGPAYYGYGFALATAIASLLGLTFISRKLERLECDTFMRQA
jgi:polysaccharide biosynthesis protein PelG